MSEQFLAEETGLARLVGARLVHDLAGPLGSVMAAAGLSGSAGESVPGARSDALLAETVGDLLARGRLYAAVFGAAEAVAAEEMPALLAGAPGAHRVQFEFAAGLDSHPAAFGQILLTAAMLAAEALPRGGKVTIAGGPGGGTVVLPDGRMAAWPHRLPERLGGLPPAQADTARSLLVPWLLALAREAGCHVSLGLGSPGVPPMLLRPGRKS